MKRFGRGFFVTVALLLAGWMPAVVVLSNWEPDLTVDKKDKIAVSVALRELESRLLLAMMILEESEDGGHFIRLNDPFEVRGVRERSESFPAGDWWMGRPQAWTGGKPPGSS
jgi:hypothetical protein